MKAKGRQHRTSNVQRSTFNVEGQSGTGRKAVFGFAQSILERYGPAMAVLEKAAAENLFWELVYSAMVVNDLSLEEAEAQERANLGYFAGYYDRATRERVFELFGAEHPVFGRHELSPEELLAWGETLGRLMRSGVDAGEATRRVRAAIEKAKGR